MGIELYLGIANETQWNHHPIDPSGPICISPMTGATERTRKKNRVFVPPDAIVIQDSGAYNDPPHLRLSPSDALARQIAHAEEYEYATQISKRVSYDWLIDEKWESGQRYKRRWAKKEAMQAVCVTVDAARYLVRNRESIPHTHEFILSVQGVTPQQYFDCATQIISLMDMQRDWLGLGGWCIIGRMRRRMKTPFLETIKHVLPYAATKGVKHIHVFGVMYPQALGWLLWACNSFGISLSTDSAGPSFRPALGEWGYGDWRDKSYARPPVNIRGRERARHVAAVRNWLHNFESTQYYRNPWEE